MKISDKAVIGIIGLGYVGLPLAVAFGKKRTTIGFDIDQPRINELKKHHDRTLETDSDDLKSAKYLRFSADEDDLEKVDVFVVTVPTPVTKSKQPDLTPLISATKTVARYLKEGNVVIYESTVFPGCTEEECVPVLEDISGLKFNREFYCGYSPERINPGDKQHRLETITKVTSGSNPEIAREIDDLYNQVIKAGTHLAPSIKVAEAAKVIENSQRDINIAFVNELSLIFEKLGIDTSEVLEAAGTKWNFLPFRPGLVGGHCIGVDPYYLTQKAESVGYHPQIILSGRRINDNMGAFISGRLLKLMVQKGHSIKNSRVLILGITFKENCPDIRNSKVIDIINELEGYSVNVDVYDPWANASEVKQEFGVQLLSKELLDYSNYQGIILAVAHHQFSELSSVNFRKDTAVYDVKSFLPREIIDQRL